MRKYWAFWSETYKKRNFFNKMLYLVQHKIFSLPIRPENMEVTWLKFNWIQTILSICDQEPKLLNYQRYYTSKAPLPKLCTYCCFCLHFNSLVKHPTTTESPEVATLGASRQGRHRWHILKLQFLEEEKGFLNRKRFHQLERWWKQPGSYGHDMFDKIVEVFLIHGFTH